MNKNTETKQLELGKYDEAELVELIEGDVYGASGFACVTASITVASAMDLCPTTACTNSC